MHQKSVQPAIARLQKLFSRTTIRYLRYKSLQLTTRMLLKLLFRVKVVGLENIPKEGPVIIVANHSSVLDSLLISAFARRLVIFIAKDNYFKWYHPMRIFVGGGNGIPVDRNSPRSGSRAMKVAIALLEVGGALGIHPEGTRTPGGMVYKGNSSFVAMAQETNARVIPVALIGTETANSPGKLSLKLWTRITVVFGEPIDLPKDPDKTLKAKLLAMGRPIKTIAKLMGNIRKSRKVSGVESPADVFARRVMERIAELGRLEYVHEPPVRAKDVAKAKSKRQEVGS